MQKLFKNIILLVTALVFLLSLIGLSFLVYMKNCEEKKEYRYFATLNAKVFSINLQRDINQAFWAGELLKYIIITNGGNTIDFEALAAEIQKNKPFIKKFVLARNGVISDFYPKNGNDSITDYLHDEQTSESSVYSIKHRTSFITGPFLLAEGMMELAINTPVYINTIGNTPYFWGFISIIIDPQVLFTNTVANIESSGYNYCLYKTGLLDHNFMKIMGIEEELNEPIKHTFEQNGSLWQLSLSPVDNWEVSDIIKPIIFTGSIGVLLLTFLIFTILKLHDKEVTLKSLSEKDELTMLSNLRSFESHLKKVARKNKPFGIIYADIDKFKQINDIYGHHVGNLTLQETAYRLEKVVKPYKVFRVGGDEFNILVTKKLSREGYNKITEAINKAFEKPIINTSKYTIMTGISTGFACTELDGNDYNDLRTLADKRMYACKQDRRQKRAF